MNTSPTYRFDVEVLRGGASTRLTCAGLAEGTIAGLARALVEDDRPDGVIMGGRPGRFDWTHPSLHRAAVPAVIRREAEDAPERLHPALRAAVLAATQARQGQPAQPKKPKGRRT